MLPNLIPSSALPTPLFQQADAMLSIDGGAMAALAVLVALAVAMVFGVARELWRTAAPATLVQVRIPRPTIARALAA